MPFQSHPLYDNAGDEWVDISSTRDAAEALDGAPWAVAFEKSRETALALAVERVRGAAGQEYLEERPHLDVNLLLLRPTVRDGFRAFVELFFSEYADRNSPNSDVWWVILQQRPSHPAVPDDGPVVIRFGWHLP